ncbi:uncharacterized protein LOC108206461 isoform X1 [Daucus carota subsp. sativus]|uniref:uncharacterized protein LOC108206461 isoform X1 n=1 Tax=Daucus carota subsp. sativus TaxID=79200 RepID=UPI0007EF72BA|nr:PREDICTED: uncharacterized protein LOC108206461 isoform X1 [Daucus carota subsp. sativus]
MANPIDSSQDDSFQIDPLIGPDSFFFTGTNQTLLPIQPSEQADQKPVVLNQIPSSELDPICDDVEALVLNPIPSSELGPICDEVEALVLNPIPSSEADLISGQEPLVLNPISSSEPNPICGEVVQATEQPLKLYPIPKTLLRSTGLNNWTMTSETQNSGASATNIDRYYIDPKTGQRFRSKAEVIRYLETGSKSKPQSGANATPSETSGKQKEKSRGKQKEKSSSKKTGTGKKEKQTGWNFDFENPPEETTWSLVDGTWKPSIGGDPVPEETVQQWAETFELVCTME